MVKQVVRAEVKWKAVVFFTPWFGILVRIVIAFFWYSPFLLAFNILRDNLSFIRWNLEPLWL